MGVVESKVLCHSGYRYAQRPYSFTWQEELLPISEVISEANTPQGRRFLVKTDNGDLYILDYFTEADAWQARPAPMPGTNR
jgi:hypothetical protein